MACQSLNSIDNSSHEKSVEELTSAKRAPSTVEEAMTEPAPTVTQPQSGESSSSAVQMGERSVVQPFDRGLQGKRPAHDKSLTEVATDKKCHFNIFH